MLFFDVLILLQEERERERERERIICTKYELDSRKRKRQKCLNSMDKDVFENFNVGLINRAHK